MFDPKQHHENSSLRESIIEHLFVGEALRLLWRRGIVDAEILRSEFDAFGYDLVISRGSIVRHVQLKSGRDLSYVTASLYLSSKPSGCIVFIEIDDELALKAFRFFGGLPGEPLPDMSEFKVAIRPTHNSQGVRPRRTMHRTITKKCFGPPMTLEELLEQLLGSDLSRGPDNAKSRKDI